MNNENNTAVVVSAVYVTGTPPAPGIEEVFCAFFCSPDFCCVCFVPFFLRFVCCVESSRGEDRSVDLVFFGL